MFFVFSCEPSSAEQYKILDNFIFETNKRLSASSKKTLFFTGLLRLFNVGSRSFTVVELNVLFPPFYLYMLFALVVSSVLFGFGWLSVVMLVLSSLGLLWTKFPYFLMLRKGLKKNGFTGRLKLL